MIRTPWVARPLAAHRPACPPVPPGPEVHCPLEVGVEDPHGRSSLKSIRVCSLNGHNSGQGRDKWLRRGRGESDGTAAKGLPLRGLAGGGGLGRGHPVRSMRCGLPPEGDEAGAEVEKETGSMPA